MVEEALNLAYHGARAEKPGFKVTIDKSLDPDAGSVDLYRAGDDPRAAEPDFQRLLRDDEAQRRASASGTYEPTVAASTRDLRRSRRNRDSATTEPAFPTR